MMADLIAMSNSIKNFIIKRSDLGSTDKSSRILQRLIGAGYLDPLDNNRLLITDRGKISMLNELVKRRKPDGKMRMVIFDIPEKLRARRNIFRKHLVDLGFKMEQQSVWSSKFPCEDLVKLVINYHSLRRFTSLIVGKLVH